MGRGVGSAIRHSHLLVVYNMETPANRAAPDLTYSNAMRQIQPDLDFQIQFGQE